MRGWSLTDLAQRSGVSRAMINKVERGEASPTASLLGRLSGAFGLTLSALLARTETTYAGRIVREKDQLLWTDPASGYIVRDGRGLAVEVQAGAMRRHARAPRVAGPRTGSIASSRRPPATTSSSGRSNILPW